MAARNYKVVDKRRRAVTPNYFPLVFFRKPALADEISRARWIWLCFVEILFGAELLENIVITVSNGGSPEEHDPERKYGHPQQLSLHIPGGIFTRLFHDQIVQLLYYKFYLQYLLITPVAKPVIDDANGLIYVERVRFRLDKALLYQVIAFRRVYVATAVASNMLADLAVYLFSQSVLAAVVAGALQEVVRRVFKL